jgi:hypothetical protein
MHHVDALTSYDFSDMERTLLDRRSAEPQEFIIDVLPHKMPRWAACEIWAPEAVQIDPILGQRFDKRVQMSLKPSSCVLLKNIQNSVTVPLFPFTFDDFWHYIHQPFHNPKQKQLSAHKNTTPPNKARTTAEFDPQAGCRPAILPSSLSPLSIDT